MTFKEMGIVFKQVEVREHRTTVNLQCCHDEKNMDVEGQMVGRTEAGGCYDGRHRGERVSIRRKGEARPRDKRMERNY